MLPFDTALAFTLPAEGGYVDNHHDKGGPTNRGITQAEYDSYRTRKGIPLRSVQLLEDFETPAIYQTDYWAKGRCGDMPLKLAVTHFDWCVNHGVQGALKTLQQVLGVPADGDFGPVTAAAVADAPVGAYYQYINLRRAWYSNRAQQRPDQAEFVAGWLKRCDQLLKYLQALT